MSEYASFNSVVDAFEADHKKKALEVRIMKEKMEVIKEYCIEHKEWMWAAHIWSIIVEKDFREIDNDKTI